MIEDEAIGQQQAIGEDRAFVGFAVTVGIFEDEDGVVGELAGQRVGVAGKAGDPRGGLWSRIAFARG